MNEQESSSLYERLGGYDAIAAVASDLLPRLMGDARLGRFWAHRGDDGLRREKQLLIDFLCDQAGGPLHYVGRDMLTAHRGMGIDTQDWDTFIWAALLAVLYLLFVLLLRVGSFSDIGRLVNNLRNSKG